MVDAMGDNIHELEIRTSRPAFLYLHLNDPHLPYHARMPWFRVQSDERERRESAYDSEIRYADEFVKRIDGRFDLGGDAGLNHSGMFLARATHSGRRDPYETVHCWCGRSERPHFE